jgi:DNA-binding protein HU-beta
MTKAELIEAVANNTRMTKKNAGHFIDVVFANVSKAVLAESRFSYPGFGTFSLRTRKARKIRNPQTGEPMRLKATKTVGFRPAKEWKDKL